ncbi:Choline-sulfatase [Pontiella sulfatireligans]|uniref:Choline-sulfatase n=2 Tax=Pontiella sulfatireligans TaxID=2750658 RepID=A0A6C2UFE2_9BACT|nr:sulfatase S1_16 [Kiritimatiellales bacterium]VGO18932.1 Choline-sulfatase [Pontiella sulfatireligans]
MNIRKNGIAMVAVAVFITVPIGMAAQQPPNIVFLYADDQGWNALSSQMDPDIPGSKSDFFQTPNLDRLCKEGMRFTQGYAPAPLCTPSRNSVQFGVTPAKARVTIINFDESRQFGNPEQALGNLIKRADSRYVTAHFGKWHIHDVSPAECGYDFSDGETTNVEGNRKPNDDLNDPTDPKRVKELTARAIDFIRTQNNAGNPFYLQVSHYADHAVFRSSPEMRAKYDKLKPGKIHADANFAAMNEDLDLGVGAILDELVRQGIADNTYVVYTSDNGWQLDKERFAVPENKSRPLRYGKNYVYEGGIRVPFIVSGPGIEPGSVSRVPVIGYDLMPTFLDMIAPGTKPPAYTEGGSMLPILKNEGKGIIKRPDDFFVFHRSVAKRGDGTAFREGSYKIIVYWETQRILLFDLSKDIGEQDDISSQHPELTQKMFKKAQKYLERVNAEKVIARKITHKSARHRKRKRFFDC